jgi:hypothetical protein
MKEIIVKQITGEEVVATDAIIVKGIIKEVLISKDENIQIDFQGVKGVDSSFMSSVFTDLIYQYGRRYLIDKINVINLQNYDSYGRVVYGTSNY